jgi:hypothetical protein
MKKGFLVLALMGLFLGVDAQDTLRGDSLLRARQNEAEAFVQKGDMYHAAYDYQLLLDQSLRDRRKVYILNAYNALIHISEKSFNYPKAFLYQSAYDAFKDSLLKEQSNRSLQSQEAAFKQYESDLNKAQEIEKARAAKYEEMLLRSREDYERLHTLVYILLGLSILLTLALVFCLVKRRPGKMMPTAAQAPVILPASVPVSVPAPVMPAAKSSPLPEPPAIEKQEPVLAVSGLKGTADVTARFHSNKLEAIFESAHAPELFIQAVQASPSDPLVLLMLASSGMEERQGLASLCERAAALSRTQTPDKVLQEVLGDERRRSAMYAVFDLKGGWLRCAGTQSALWLIRKGELKEFGTLTSLEVRTEVSAIPMHTLGLRKGDWLFLVLAEKEADGKLETQLMEIRDALLKSSTAEPGTITNRLRENLAKACQAEAGISFFGVCI